MARLSLSERGRREVFRDGSSQLRRLTFPPVPERLRAVAYCSQRLRQDRRPPMPQTCGSPDGRTRDSQVRGRSAIPDDGEPSEADSALRDGNSAAPLSIGPATSLHTRFDSEATSGPRSPSRRIRTTEGRSEPATASSVCRSASSVHTTRSFVRAFLREPSGQLLAQHHSSKPSVGRTGQLPRPWSNS